MWDEQTMAARMILTATSCLGLEDTVQQSDSGHHAGLYHESGCSHITSPGPGIEVHDYPCFPGKETEALS